MSGGVSEVHAEDLYFFNSSNGIRIKTSCGRGGYVRNVYVSNVTLDNVNIALRFTGGYGEHPDDKYDPEALPVVEGITFANIMGDNVTMAGLMEGIEGDTFNNVCLLNITLKATAKIPWNCSYIQGYSHGVSPHICKPLSESIFPDHCSDCYQLLNPLQSTIYWNSITRFLPW